MGYLEQRMENMPKSTFGIGPFDVHSRTRLDLYSLCCERLVQEQPMHTAIRNGRRLCLRRCAELPRAELLRVRQRTTSEYDMCSGGLFWRLQARECLPVHLRMLEPRNLLLRLLARMLSTMWPEEA